MLGKIQRWLEGIFETGNMPTRRPLVDAHHESSVPGLYVVGDLTGAPVIKYAMAQGYEVIEHIAQQPDARANNPDLYDVIVVGAGAAGLNAALAAKEKGLRCLGLEKNKVANTIEDFPEGKWIYAEPEDRPPKGKLWLDGATKEDLLNRWHEIIRENKLDVRTEDGLQRLSRQPDGSFLLDGEKMWITNGGFTDLVIVFAKVDGEHFSAFLVERGFPGVSSGKEEHKMGLHGSSTTPILLQQAQVPADMINTKHNLSFTGPGTIKATTETQICVFCHTPHGANLDQPPLWNRTLSTANYTPYTSPSLQSSPGQVSGSLTVSTAQ